MEDVSPQDSPVVCPEEVEEVDEGEEAGKVLPLSIQSRVCAFAHRCFCRCHLISSASIKQLVLVSFNGRFRISMLYVLVSENK